jgi:hypothetical protein
MAFMTLRASASSALRITTASGITAAGVSAAGISATGISATSVMRSVTSLSLLQLF